MAEIQLDDKQKNELNSEIKRMIAEGRPKEEIIQFKENFKSGVKDLSPTDQTGAPSGDTGSASGDSSLGQSFPEVKSGHRAVGGGEDIGAWESVGNSVHNLWERLTTLDDKAGIVVTDALTSVFGEENVDALYSMVPTYDTETGELLDTADEVRNAAYKELAASESRMKDTIGIIESFKGEDATVGDKLAAVFGAGTNVVPSLIAFAINPVFGGAVTFNELAGDALYSANTKKAEAQGKTIEELYEDGEAEIAVPMFAAAAGSALERLGFKGVTGKLINKIGSKGAAKALRLAEATGTEGTTEWLQFGIESWNENRVVDGDELAAGKAITGLFTEEGAEMFLQGLVGGGLAGGRKAWKGSEDAKTAVATKSAEQKQEMDDAIENAADYASAADAAPTPEAKDLYNKKYKDEQEKIKDLHVKHQEEIAEISNYDKAAVNGAQDEITGLREAIAIVENDGKLSPTKKEKMIAGFQSEIESQESILKSYQDKTAKGEFKKKEEIVGVPDTQTEIDQTQTTPTEPAQAPSFGETVQQFVDGLDADNDQSWYEQAKTIRKYEQQVNDGKISEKQARARIKKTVPGFEYQTQDEIDAAAREEARAKGEEVLEPAEQAIEDEKTQIKEDVVKEELQDNVKQYDDVVDTLAGFNIFETTDGTNEAPRDMVQGMSPFSEGNTVGDYVKTFKSEAPLGTRAEAKQAELALNKIAKTKKFDAKTKIVPNEDGTFGIETTVSKQRPDKTLDQLVDDTHSSEYLKDSEGLESTPEGVTTTKDQRAAYKAVGGLKKRGYTGARFDPNDQGGFDITPGEKGAPEAEFSLDESRIPELTEQIKASRPGKITHQRARNLAIEQLRRERDGGPDVEYNLEEGTPQSKEVDRVKNLPIESEDGATFNPDGTVYDKGGLVVPIASQNLKASELSDDAIEKFKKKYKDYMGPASKIGIYKFPGQDQVSIDLNVIAPSSKRDAALKIGKSLGQESLFDLDTFENIKTGETGANPKSINAKQAKRISEQLGELDKDIAGDIREDIQARQDARAVASKPRRQTKTATKEQLAEVKKGRKRGGIIQSPERALGTEEFAPAFDRSDVGGQPSRTAQEAFQKDVSKQDRFKYKKGTKAEGVNDQVVSDYVDGKVSDDKLITSLIPVATREGNYKDPDSVSAALEGLVNLVKGGKFKPTDGKDAFNKVRYAAKNAVAAYQRGEATGEPVTKDVRTLSNKIRQAEDKFFKENGFEATPELLEDFIGDPEITAEKINDNKARLFVEGEGDTGLPATGAGPTSTNTTEARQHQELDNLSNTILDKNLDSEIQDILSQSVKAPSPKSFQDQAPRRGAGFKTKGDPASDRIKKSKTEVDKDVRELISKNITAKSLERNFDQIADLLGLPQTSWDQLSLPEKRKAKINVVKALANEAESRLGKQKREGTRSPEFNLSERFNPLQAAPQEYIDRVSAVLQRAFPGINVASSPEAYNKALEGIKAPPGIKGAYITAKNTVAINPSKATLDTPIHEFAHIWAKALMRNNPKLWKKGMELLKGSKYARTVYDNPVYREYLKNEPSRFWEEVMANALGKRGAEVFTENSKDASKWNRYVKAVGNWLKDKLNISSKNGYADLTLDDWLNAGVGSILTGEAITAPTEGQVEYSLEADPVTDSDVAAARLEGKKADGKWYTKPISRWLIPPAADDYHGLVSKLTGIDTKAVTDAFVNNHHDYVNASTATRQQVKTITKALKNAGVKLDKSDVATVEGNKLTAAQAIQAHIDGKSSPSLDKFLNSKGVKEYVDAMKQLGVLKPSTGERSYDSASPQADLVRYIVNDLYADHFQEFNQAKDQVFGKDTMNKIRKEKGNKYADALENSLQRMSTGKTSAGFSDKTTQKWNDWALGSVGAVMFFNFRSAALQMLSVGNYGFSSPKPGAFAANFLSPDTWKGAIKRFNSPYLKERRARAGFDVNAREMYDMLQDSSSYSDFTKKVLNFGFKATSFVDSVAIAMGGEAFVRSGGTESQWKEQTEEAQQSSRPDRVSQWQTEGVSKFVLAFANTPQQYFRLGQKAFRTIKDPKATAQEKTAAFMRMGWYLAAQNMIFTAAQAASTAMFGFGDDDDDKEELQQLNSMAGTILRGMGLVGAVIDAGKNVIAKAIEENSKARPDHVASLLRATSISPPLNKKINDLVAIGKGYNYDNPDKHVTAVAKGITTATNLPTDWVQKKYNAAKALSDEQYDNFQKLLILAGWSEWQFKKKDKEISFDDIEFDDVDFEDVEFEDVDFN